MLTVDQVKNVFATVYCTGCIHGECLQCEIGKMENVFFTMLENISIINDIDENTAKNESLKP